jgi:hypothetical protein
MKKMILAAAVATSFAMLSSAALAECLAFPQENYQGTPLLIPPGHLAIFHSEPNNHNNKSLVEFRAPQFLNNIKSSQSSPGCELGLSVENDLTKGSAHYQGHKPKHFFKTPVTAATCTCK